MARHKVYILDVGAYKGDDRKNNRHPVGARASIDSYSIRINADTNDGRDIEGTIDIRHINGEVFIIVDCPSYYVNIMGSRGIIE